jgi:hypothetical protein
MWSRRRAFKALLQGRRESYKGKRPSAGSWFPKVKSEISLGEILTVFVILLSAFSLGYGWYKDRELRKHEDAELIRQNAGTVTAKLERWAVLSSRYYSDIQPLLVESSAKLVENHQLRPASDILFRGLFEAQAKSSQRAIDEQVEIAYSGLYGYDPKVYNLFVAAVCQLKEKDQEFADQAVVDTADILRQDQLQEDSSVIHENLRNKCASLHLSLQSEMEKIIDPFRQEMIKLIRSSDDEIVNRKVVIASPEAIFPNIGNGKCKVSRTPGEQQPQHSPPSVQNSPL